MDKSPSLFSCQIEAIVHILLLTTCTCYVVDQVTVGELIYMTRARDKEKSESLTGIEPMTFRTPGRFMRSEQRERLAHPVFGRSWVWFLSGTQICLCPMLVSSISIHLSHLLPSTKIHHLYSLGYMCTCHQLFTCAVIGQAPLHKCIFLNYF